MSFLKNRFNQIFNKPKLIKELEQELNATFKLVDIEIIMEFGGKTQYAINEKGKIIGLKINNFELKDLPKNIKEFKDLQFLNLYNNEIINILH